MKTTVQNFSNMFRSAILASSMVILGFSGSVQATTLNSTTSNLAVTSIQTFPDNDEVAGQAASTESMTMILKDAKFWVNYLKNTVKAEDDTIQVQANTVDEMQSDPTYWIHYLKETAVSE